MATIDQPTSAPSPKVSAGTLGASAAALAYALLAARFPALKDPVIWIPVAPALSGAIAFVSGYLKREQDALTREIEGSRGWIMLGLGVAALAALGAVLWMTLG